MPHPNDRERPFLRRVALFAAAMAIVSGLVVVVVGWVLDVAIVKSVIPGSVGMKSSTASLFVLTGVALLARLRPPTDRRAACIARVCTTLILLIALAFLVEYVFDVHLGIDELPFRDVDGRAKGIAFPGRLAPTTAAAFAALAVSLLIFNMRRADGIHRWLAIVVAGPAAMTVVGYAYAIPAFYGPNSATKMALNTGVLLLIVAAGVMAAHPSDRLKSMIAAPDPGSVMTRRLVPICVVGPFVLGWLRLFAVHHGLFSDRVGTWSLTTATMLGLCALLLSSGRRMKRADAERAALANELEHLAHHDPLTGLLNRRRFDEEVERELSVAQRYGEPGALLMIDLDSFKPINDTHGHTVGDQLLQNVAQALGEPLRRSDFLARFGGDEFVVFLPRVNGVGASLVAGRLLEDVRSIVLPFERPNGTTASIGIATTLGRHTASSLVHAADQAMYVAKQSGGDQIAETPAIRAEAVAALVFS